MASRPPLASSWICVRQLKPSASTTAAGSASRSRGKQHLLGEGFAHLGVPALEAEAAGQSSTTAVLVHWPARLVPPPRDSTGTACSRHTATASTAPSGVRGTTTPIGT
jgi:hypothetical protein